MPTSTSKQTVCSQGVTYDVTLVYLHGHRGKHEHYMTPGISKQSNPSCVVRETPYDGTLHLLSEEETIRFT